MIGTNALTPIIMNKTTAEINKMSCGKIFFNSKDLILNENNGRLATNK